MQDRITIKITHLLFSILRILKSINTYLSYHLHRIGLVTALVIGVPFETPTQSLPPTTPQTLWDARQVDIFSFVKHVPRPRHQITYSAYTLTLLPMFSSFFACIDARTG
ncbi:hypothetical protein CDAR_85211 [Caerostris darwini]|uniref:Uncharacterized protein n=1 Tax=Caerostris darwini TaxID=1538125 RepID=A0AAV4N0Z9_9ARAC|nr:hypothetical protein CDAR_85211 [Caerostris darwini]